MRREQRLRRRRDFAAVYRRSRVYRGEAVVLRARRNEGGPSRFGFTTGQAVGKAVVRNKVKRRLREAARSLPVAPGWDIVLNARPKAARVDYHRLREEVAGLMRQAKLLEER